MNSILFIFPGQGSQYTGIGRDLYDGFETARDVYHQANDAVGYDIAKLSFSGEEEQLKLTRHTQPVLLTHAVTCLEVFRERSQNKIKPQFTAGHSLGEYSALVAAGAVDFARAVKLVKQRGEFMGELGEGEMEALALDLGTARPLADRFYCGISACNLDDQTVVGGRADDLDRLVAELNELYPRKRSVRLKTEGAFHTYYMVEAARRFRPVLEAATFIPGGPVKVLSNYNGGLHGETETAIRSGLFLQLFSPVLWQQNLNAAVSRGVDTIIEFGGGIGRGETAADKRPNLEGIVKKTFRRVENPPQYHAVINLETLENTLSALTR